LFGVVHVRPLFSILQGHTLEQSGNKQQQIHSTMLYSSIIDPETQKKHYKMEKMRLHGGTGPL
jgi:hypothetical protein